VPEPSAVPPQAPDASAAAQERAITAAAALTAVIAAGLVSYAVFLCVEWFRETPAEPLNAGLIIGFSLLWGLALVFCARGLLDRRRWSRAPALTSALMLLAIGWLLVHGHGTEVVFGWVVLLIAVSAVVALGRPTLGTALR
jgi:hypothetical protein